MRVRNCCEGISCERQLVVKLPKHALKSRYWSVCLAGRGHPARETYGWLLRI